MSLTSFWADSRGKVIVVLLLVWLVALRHHFQWLKVLYPLTAVIAVSLFDWIITRVRSRIHVVSLSSIVTGLLIGLILDPNGSLWFVIVASILAVLNKQFIRSAIHRHIFNPATFGIVISAELLRANIAWWAVSWGIWPVAIIGIGMSLVLWRIRRLFLPLTFIIVYFGLNLFRVGFIDSFRLIFDGTVFLFAFVMVPEPMTSLARGAWQYAWGILVGALLLFWIRLPIQVIDPLLTALLTANIVGFLVLNRQLKT